MVAIHRLFLQKQVLYWNKKPYDTQVEKIWEACSM
jgi:hypothetical protein